MLTIMERDTRLDVLKCIAITLVLVWHLRPLPSMGPLWRLDWVTYWELGLLGVPVLLLISLYLFDRRAARGGRYVARRLGYLVLMLAVWGIVQTVVYLLVDHHLPSLSWQLVYMDGPALPKVGDSVFYFLFDLLLLTAASYAYFRLPARVRTAVGVLVIVASLALFEASSLEAIPALHYFSPLNFLIYVPLAAWLAEPRSYKRLRWYALAAWVVLFAHDLVLAGPVPLSRHLTDFSYYGRASLAAGAVALLTLTLAAKPRRVPLLERAGRYSLGIFALHKYAWYVVATIVADSFLDAHANLEPPLIALLAVAATLVAVWLVAQSPLRRWVGERQPRPLAAAEGNELR